MILPCGGPSPVTVANFLSLGPIRFYRDLIDATPDAFPACDATAPFACGPISDVASGFTNAQMFALLDPSTTSPLIFKERLILGASTTTKTQVNNLYNSY